MTRAEISVWQTCPQEKRGCEVGSVAMELREKSYNGEEGGDRFSQKTRHSNWYVQEMSIFRTNCTFGK
jgi:hypothetical protein